VAYIDFVSCVYIGACIGAAWAKLLRSIRRLQKHALSCNKFFRSFTQSTPSVIRYSYTVHTSLSCAPRTRTANQVVRLSHEKIGTAPPWRLRRPTVVEIYGGASSAELIPDCRLMTSRPRCIIERVAVTACVSSSAFNLRSLVCDRSQYINDRSHQPSSHHIRREQRTARGVDSTPPSTRTIHVVPEKRIYFIQVYFLMLL